MEVIEKIREILEAILPLLISLGVIYLIWGIVQYFIGNSEEAKKNGRDRIIYGIIGLVIIISIWGLVYLVTTTLGIKIVGEEGGNAPIVSTLAPEPASGSRCDNVIASNPRLQHYMGYVTCIINDAVIPLIFALAIALFLWGAVQFLILHGGEEAKRTQGKQLMIWGIIALVVMVGIWGLVKIVGGTFFSNFGNTLPQVKP